MTAATTEESTTESGYVTSAFAVQHDAARARATLTQGGRAALPRIPVAPPREAETLRVLRPGQEVLAGLGPSEVQARA